jgi:hypothetical protein
VTSAAAFDVLALLNEVPPGDWAAVSERQNRVLAFGPDIAQVLEDGRGKSGDEEPIIVRSPGQPMPLFL